MHSSYQSGSPTRQARGGPGKRAACIWLSIWFTHEASSRGSRTGAVALAVNLVHPRGKLTGVLEKELRAFGYQSGLPTRQARGGPEVAGSDPRSYQSGSPTRQARGGPEVAGSKRRSYQSGSPTRQARGGLEVAGVSTVAINLVHPRGKLVGVTSTTAVQVPRATMCSQ